MAIHFRLADKDDVELILSIQNQAFFDDYKRFGFCPGYNQPVGQMNYILNSSSEYYDYLIYDEDLPVGNLIVKVRDRMECHLKSLCIVTLRQSSGIGSLALRFLEDEFRDCEKITLETYADKTENLRFYQKNGFLELKRMVSYGIACAVFEKKI